MNDTATMIDGWTEEDNSTPVYQTIALNELAAALAKAQGEIRNAVRDTENEFFSSSYADLAAVWDACRKPLSDNGLSIIQRGKMTTDGYIMCTRLLHSSGQWTEGEVPCITAAREKQNAMQQLGSAITYARRYGLAAMVGVAPEVDDDAEGAEKRKPMHGDEPVMGKMKKTELQQKMRDFDGDLWACEDMDTLMGMLKDYGDALEQCKRELPTWYFGKQGSDAPGIEDRIRQVREKLRLKEVNPLDGG